MSQSLFQRSFASGELAPALRTRADLAKYQQGLRSCSNFIVRRSGGITNRPGTRKVAETKASGASAAALYPFIFASSAKCFVIEAGDAYFRFHKNGAPVTVTGATAWSALTTYVVGDLASRLGVTYYCILGHLNQQPPNATYWYPLPIVGGQNIYEIPTPYAAGAFFAPTPAKLEQSGLVVTITHLNYPPMELTFTSDTTWVLTAIATAPSMPTPAAGAGTPGAVGTRNNRYLVTAVRGETYEESLPSTVIDVLLAAAPTVDAPHSIAWTNVAGAVEYRVYGDGASENGIYGFLGKADGTPFRDTGFTPDYTQGPPIPRVLFGAVLNYPGVSTVYQQRRIFAGTHTDREIVYGSKVGFRSNFSIRSPLQDDDAVTFKIAAKFIQPILHLVALQTGLVTLTDAGEWMVKGDGERGGALLPTAINPWQYGWVGATDVDPVVIGEAIVFVQARGTILRDLRFDEKVEGLSGRDLTLYASHLVDGFTLDDIAYASVPHSCVWCVRSDGKLLGLTYVREEDVWGWHHHETPAGNFEQVCVIPEGNEDAVYVIVQRSVNGVSRRFVERFASRFFDDVADALFLDCAITLENEIPSVTVTGLTHLAGEEVMALADGIVRGPFIVSLGGVITLPVAATTVQAGLAYTSEAELLDLDIAGSTLRDKRKTVKAVALELEASYRGFRVGPNAANLYPVRAETWDTSLVADGRVEITTTTSFTEHGRMLIRHTDPLPLTILGVLPHIEVGG